MISTLSFFGIQKKSSFFTWIELKKKTATKRRWDMVPWPTAKELAHPCQGRGGKEWDAWLVGFMHP